MHLRKVGLRALALMVLLAAPATVPAQPGFAWQSAAPESQGMSGARLAVLKDSLAVRNTSGFLVIRNDMIVYEWYAPGHGPTVKHGTASLIKALLAGLGLGIALEDGLVDLDDPVAKYVPEWRDDPRKSKITLRHLGSHTSGLADAEVVGVAHDKLDGWRGDFWKRLEPPNDPFTIARDQTPAVFDAGAQVQYSNPGIAMLSYAVTAALQKSQQKDLRSLLRERVMRPLGVPDSEWAVGYDRTFTVKGLPLVPAWGGGNFTARAVASIGRLLLHGGDWEGKRILSPKVVRQITGSAGLPGNCGMGWWTNADGRYAKLPRDAFWGAGAGDQVVLVVPSLNLIMVRNGTALAKLPSPTDAVGKPRDVFALYHDERTALLFEPVVAAVTGASPTGRAAPYPPSKIITGIDWAPKATIVRQAKGSDNWPMTWGDDDFLYTAYGDGWGFEPLLPHKLGLGFAKVAGAPPDFKGSNIRSPSGEQIGNGAVAKKASGILMVGGVLYLWTRNAGNSQLAWSSDHGNSWVWSDWKFMTSFGCPTFLNYGKNYDGATDDYVYVYSHDHADAYVPADVMVLARVPRERIRERSAYEFFKCLDADKRPVWTKAVDERGAVFAHKDGCCRSTISYHPGLKRFLWVQTLPALTGNKVDRRFEGGFGIYDSPEPWGPWSTAYFTDKWDVGPGETASLPTKWMSRDGSDVYLVFSGDDNFCVRRGSLILGHP